MQSDNPPTSKGSKSQKRGISFDLFYFEQVGARQYLRFTRLTLMIILGLTIISIGMMLVFFTLSSQSNDTSDINVNITSPSHSPTQPIIIQQPPKLSPLRSNKQMRTSVPVPSPPSLQMVDELQSATPTSTTTQIKSSNNRQQ
jgi:multisubunit Na+/H+ antiporter MnhC subunit